MDSTAAVKFLGSIGIYDFPIFSLLIEGSVGVVCIFERAGRSFDISTATGMFRYASFLCMLAHEHAHTLLQALEKHSDSFLDRFEKQDPSVRWSMSHQKMDFEGQQPQPEAHHV
ncbi:hypothetical protein HETIRDRAFT_308827 [Heterobasidion irregulare TC 32-1]|uniref:Uncharacterized protein n=1 Tax=Heterobasidion irregulare (strain TC 32-1) TaxID=747525 RepID=W4KKX1_HETIT|nr:uncharacterized protein HETIRDRAFT_308827 [Heterobasidion irregulare TC 32-1]ETW86334.1 hypothetical protein HETIRDRAFT_308827 [Heterobasidion irregulare TC 32-1]